MASAFAIAIAAGVAVASVNALFARRDGRRPVDVLRTFLAWLLAFAVAGLVARPVASWLLANVF